MAAKRFCVLAGSPRPAGNTAELLKPFVEQLEQNGGLVEVINLSDKDIQPCMGCHACQEVEGRYGCVRRDDVEAILARVIASDCLVLATPIYTWYCTAPMKALLDRHYGLNKFYGSAKGSLWAGKKVAIVATHGYSAADGAGPFEEGIRRLCRHSKLEYLGMYSVRDVHGLADFQTEAAVAGARQFANRLIET